MDNTLNTEIQHESAITSRLSATFDRNVYGMNTDVSQEVLKIVSEIKHPKKLTRRRFPPGMTRVEEKGRYMFSEFRTFLANVMKKQDCNKNKFNVPNGLIISSFVRRELALQCCQPFILDFGLDLETDEDVIECFVDLVKLFRRPFVDCEKTGVNVVSLVATDFRPAVLRTRLVSTVERLQLATFSCSEKTTIVYPSSISGEFSLNI
jgi:hypothetical protein